MRGSSKCGAKESTLSRRNQYSLFLPRGSLAQKAPFQICFDICSNGGYADDADELNWISSDDDFDGYHNNAHQPMKYVLAYRFEDESFMY